MVVDIALHSGIDTTAFVSYGVYSKTYGASGKANIANLFVSYGLIEDAPEYTPSTLTRVFKLIGKGFRKMFAFNRLVAS